MLALSVVVFVYNLPFCFRGAVSFEYTFEHFKKEYSFFCGKGVSVGISVSRRMSL